MADVLTLNTFYVKVAREEKVRLDAIIYAVKNWLYSKLYCLIFLREFYYNFSSK